MKKKNKILFLGFLFIFACFLESRSQSIKYSDDIPPTATYFNGVIHVDDVTRNYFDVEIPIIHVD